MILAGGEGRRMGGVDKGLLTLGGGTLLSHVIARIEGQAGALALNANGDADRFAGYGLPVHADAIPGEDGALLGPLAGVLTGMIWAEGLGAQRVLTVAADTPFLPDDLVARLTACEGEGPVLAQSASGRHPTCGLWPVRLRVALEEALGHGTRRLGQWAQAQGAVWVMFEGNSPDPFFNINTPEDLATAQTWADV